MARGRKALEPKEDKVEALKPIDAARAKKIILEDILPAVTKVGEHAQEVSTAYKAIKKNCSIPSHIVRLTIKWRDMEDAKRDHELRALHEMLSVFGMEVIEPDLVDKAAGVNGRAVVPTRTELAQSDEGHGGLATLADDENSDVEIPEGDFDLATAADTEPRSLSLQ